MRNSCLNRKMYLSRALSFMRHYIRANYINNNGNKCWSLSCVFILI
eukprot:UN27348